MGLCVESPVQVKKVSSSGTSEFQGTAEAFRLLLDSMTRKEARVV